MSEKIFYFIGVTTGGSSMKRIFPRWMERLGREDVRFEGIDLELAAAPERYRRVITQIKENPQVLGGLVTTHKLDLYRACRDLFDWVDPYASLCQEVSCIAKQVAKQDAKQDGQLQGYAKDPISAGRTLDAMLGPNYFGQTGGHVLCLGAGGAAVAISLHLINQAGGEDRPVHFSAVDISPERLAHLRQMHATQQSDIQFDYVLNTVPSTASSTIADQLLAQLPPHSLVINATGMGKDRPGSPISDAARFPKQGIAWELNYRGDLRFLQQAQAQASQQDLRVEDGWVYFLHGWTQVIAQVLQVTIEGQRFEELAAIANAYR